MKKKLEDFMILKYAVDQLMVASITNDNVYKLSNSKTVGSVYMIPLNDFYGKREYVGFTKRNNRAFILRTHNYFFSSSLWNAICDDDINVSHESDVVAYVSLSVSDYTIKRLIEFAEKREVSRADIKVRDVKGTWRKNVLNNIMGVDK